VNRRPLRRTRLLAAALAASAIFAMATLAGLAPPGAAATLDARRGGASTGTSQSPAIIIDSITPAVAGPGATVTVSGQFQPGPSTPLQDLVVQLWTSGSQFTARSQLADFAAGSYQPAYGPVASAALPGGINPGQTVHWRESFKVDQVGMHGPGINVYPLAAAVKDLSAGTQVAVKRTFLPFWPGKTTGGQPVRIAWVWPLIDQPQRGICPGMLDNSLAASLGAGRLAGLLDVGRDFASGAKLTWAVDPALLDDAGTMTHSYQILTGPDCWQVKTRQASSAARGWLATLHAVTGGPHLFATPYADPDVAALTHQGLDADLGTALSAGAKIAATYLNRPNTTIAWPPDGIADAGVVDNLVAQDDSVHGGSLGSGIQTVVLDSTMMPPTNPSLYYTPDAVAEVHTGIGKTVRVLLADHDLSTVLADIPATASSGTDSVTATSQRFLAETAMIAAQAPNLRRSVVVAPPGRWNPGTALASRLLSDTVSAPWLRPAYLDSLAPVATPQGIPAPDRASLPSNRVGGGLTARYLQRVQDLSANAQLIESIRTRPTGSYRFAIARLESSAWRGGGQPQGLDLLAQADAYVDSQEHMVAIIPSSEVTLGGSRGSVPVSIGNKMPVAIQVRLQATVPATRGLTPSVRLTIGPKQAQLVNIGPGQKQTVRLQVHAYSAGVTTIRLRLLTPQGVPFPGSDRTLKVRATAFGTLALVIVVVALVVLVITFVARVLRRGLREGRPGSVVAEGNGTDDDGSAEAPDELADARGRAQRDAGQ
jgi:Family of unknown function (DUF6049)